MNTFKRFAMIMVLVGLPVMVLHVPAWSLPAKEQGGTAVTLPCTFEQFPTIFESSVAIKVPPGPVKLIPSISGILSLAVDSHATVWAGTENGLLSFVPATKTGSLFTSLQGLPFNRITSLIPSGDTLWIASSPHGPSNPAFGGLTAKDESGFRTFGPRQGLVCNWIDTMLLVDHTLYISTPRGLSFFDTGSQKFIYRKEGLSAGHSVYDGRSLLLEAGTVMPTPTELVSFNLETMILSRRDTRGMLGFDRLASMAFYDGRIWATGYRLEKAKPEPHFQFEGLHIFDRHTGKLTMVDLPAGLYGESLTLKTAGPDLWFFSDRGFGPYREGRLTFYRAGDSELPSIPHMVAMTAGASPATWMARSPFLMKLDRKGLTCYRFTGCLSSNLITSLASAYDSLWAGTEPGTIDRLNGKGEVIAVYGKDRGLPGAPVAELFHDGAQNLYARCEAEGDKKSGAPGKFLVRYDPGLDRWQEAQGWKGEKSLDCRNFPAKYLPLIAKLKLDTPEGKVLMVEGRDCSWLSTYGSGIVRIEK